jgi:DNA-directed RNA polymerase specialized sigma24 family protein
MMAILNSLPARERQALVAYYCDGQTPEAVCASHGISPRHFRASAAACAVSTSPPPGGSP